MGNQEQQPQQAGTGATAAEAAAELAEIRRRQERVIKAALVPVWYWWAFAVPIVAIGAARDNLVAQAITIPLAVLVMVVLIGAAIPELRRRVKVHSSPQVGARTAVALFGMIVLVDTAILSTAASLHAAHYRYPGTVGCAAGAAVLVIAGPLLNRYARRLMLSQARQQLGGAPQAAGTP